MNDATPREVAWHFGIAAALSLSTVAAPFVPEAIMLYAGYRYLRHFTYGLRTWRAPARIPQHLGAKGYRDETTRRPGDATWPIGLAETGQVWLRREDLMQGSRSTVTIRPGASRPSAPSSSAPATTPTAPSSSKTLTMRC